MEEIVFGAAVLGVLAYILSRLERVGSGFLLALLTLVMWPVGIIAALETNHSGGEDRKSTRRRGPGSATPSNKG